MPQDDQAYGVASAELKQFIEQVEALNSEAADIAERRKEVFAEAKARGYQIPAMKAVIAMRKRDRDDLAEHDAVVTMYREAVGV